MDNHISKVPLTCGTPVSHRTQRVKKHILKDIVPHGFDARIEEIQEKHKQVIEEKDATIALLNDGLKNCEYENVC